MSERTRQIQVGIVFILSAIILVAGVLWFRNYRMTADTIEVTVEFPSTSGLVRGDPVEVRGVTSGQVREIRFERGRALVILQIRETVQLFPDSRFVIEPVSIMGQKMVAIYPGDGIEPLPAEETTFQGDYQPGIPEFIADMSEVLESFDRLTLRLDEVMDAFQMPDGDLARTIRNVEQASASIARLSEDARGSLIASLQSVDGAMSALQRNLDRHEDDLSELLENASRTTASLDSAIINVSRVAVQAQGLFAGMENGEGSMGSFMQDETLYDELVVTLRETRTLVEDIRNNPRRYVRLSLF